MKIFSTHGLLSKGCRKTSCTYKNRGEMVTKSFFILKQWTFTFCTATRQMTTPIAGTNKLVQKMCGKHFGGVGVFTFLFYVTTIITYRIHHHFKECHETSTLDFRFESSFQMILNDLLESISNHGEFKNRKRSGQDCGHEQLSIPKFCGKWVGDVWRKVKQEYQKKLCVCGKNTRHYCGCNKALLYCSKCYEEHILSVSTYNESGNEFIV